MAGNSVSITFAGDSASLEKTFANVGSKAAAMSGDLDKADSKARGLGGALDKAGESAGNSESKFMGTADLLDGLGGAFGLPTEGATGMMRAFGDLSGGFEVVSGMFKGGLAQLGQLATSIGLTSAATSVWTGIQTAFNAVMALNPVMLTVIAIAALVAGLVLAYQHSETFREIVKKAFDVVLSAATAVWDFIKELPGKLMGIGGAIKDAVLWPYKTAFNLIARLWNDTVGKLSFEIPSWVPGVGGKGFSMPQLPTFHTGGIVPGPLGLPIPVLALGGESFSPGAGGAAAGGGTTVIQLVVDGKVLTEIVHSGLLIKQRRTPLGLAT